MQIRVQLHSYFKELTGHSEVMEQLTPGASVSDLLEQFGRRFPRWAPASQCTLVAVGVEYQDRRYVLQPGDEVSLFPPVQGG